MREKPIGTFKFVDSKGVEKPDIILPPKKETAIEKRAPGQPEQPIGTFEFESEGETKTGEVLPPEEKMAA